MKKKIEVFKCQKQVIKAAKLGKTLTVRGKRATDWLIA